MIFYSNYKHWYLFERSLPWVTFPDIRNLSEVVIAVGQSESVDVFIGKSLIDGQRHHPFVIL